MTKRHWLEITHDDVIHAIEDFLSYHPEYPESSKLKTVPTAIIVRKEPTCDQIAIPSKQVIEQKNALRLLLNKMFDGDIVCEKTYSWLKTPAELTGSYATLYKALSTYRGDTSFAKKNVVLR